ncbi:hypothetical protein LDENG_00245290 [Lucifuga dentata]|nr:hypothetical protein LDENG_00245290 [Lucifuga dentata]
MFIDATATKLSAAGRNCGNPGEVANGHIDFVDGNSLYGDKIAITCSEGYRLIGKREIACGEKGWRDHLPLCEVVRCLPPSDIANVNFSPLKEVYDFREVIQYKCEKDLTLDGSKTATCSDDEKFKPDPPICKKVECHEDNIRNAEWVAGARPPYGYFMSVTFQCKTGYGNEAKFTLICGINNRWTPEPPACEPNKVLSTTTTTRPPTVKVPSTTTITIHPPIIKTAAPAGTTPPGSGGSQWWQSWWFIILAIICSVVLIAGGCRYCGCLAFIKNKRRSRRGYSGNVATNDDEGKL